jgi:hypothetical protein
MPLISKRSPGGDSFGHDWPTAGTIVEVTPDEATALLAIPDGGFAEVLPPAVDDEDDDGENTSVDEAPKAPRRGGRPKARPAADPTLVEE